MHKSLISVPTPQLKSKQQQRKVRSTIKSNAYKIQPPLRISAQPSNIIQDVSPVYLGKQQQNTHIKIAFSFFYNLFVLIEGLIHTVILALADQIYLLISCGWGKLKKLPKQSEWIFVLFVIFYIMFVAPCHISVLCREKALKSMNYLVNYWKNILKQVR